MVNRTKKGTATTIRQSSVSPKMSSMILYCFPEILKLKRSYHQMCLRNKMPVLKSCLRKGSSYDVSIATYGNIANIRKSRMSDDMNISCTDKENSSPESLLKKGTTVKKSTTKRIATHGRIDMKKTRSTRIQKSRTIHTKRQTIRINAETNVVASSRKSTKKRSFARKSPGKQK